MDENAILELALDSPKTVFKSEKPLKISLNFHTHTTQRLKHWCMFVFAFSMFSPFYENWNENFSGLMYLYISQQFICRFCLYAWIHRGFLHNFPFIFFFVCCSSFLFFLYNNKLERNITIILNLYTNKCMIQVYFAMSLCYRFFLFRILVFGTTEFIFSHTSATVYFTELLFY